MVNNVPVAKNVVHMGRKVYRSVFDLYTPVWPLTAIPCCKLCTSTCHDRMHLCKGRPACARLPKLAT